MQDRWSDEQATGEELAGKSWASLARAMASEQHSNSHVRSECVQMKYR